MTTNSKMKNSFKKALTIFKYLAILFTVVYWVGIFIDDCVFFEKYFTQHWVEYISVWFIYFSIYFLLFSIYYWTTAIIIIFIYFKLILRIKSNHRYIERK
jgi:hypothetical protein